MAQIKIKRGLQDAVKNLELAEGELAVALDTGNVYVGITSGKIHVNPSGGTADTAVKLQTPRNFSASGDVVAGKVSFDGTADVNLVLGLSEISGLTAGTYTKLTIDKKGRVTAATELAVEDLPGIPASKIEGLGTAATKAAGNAAGNVPLIGSDGKLSTTIIPSLAITDTFEAESETAMLALTCQKGDVCIRTDVAKTFILKQEPASTLANWAWLRTPDYVQYTHPAYTERANGLYKVTVDNKGHVSDVAAVTKEDITKLGIPGSDTKYTLPAATQSILGGVKVGDGIDVANGVISVSAVDGGTF